MNDAHDTNNSSIGLSDLIIWFRTNWLMITAPVVAFAILGAVYAFVAAPEYKVSTLLAPAESSASNQALGQLSNQLGALGLGRMFDQEQTNQVDVSIAVLESRRFLGEFISRHNLMPVLFASRWDDEAKDWQQDGAPPPSINDGYRKFKRNLLVVDKDEVTGFVTVSIEWKDAPAAHGWLVALISDLNGDIRQRERNEATQSLQFLSEELKRTDLMDLRVALNQLSLAELQKLTLANVREEFAFKIIDPPNLPDADDPVWPKPLLIVLGGTFLGFFAGLFLAMVLTAWRAAFRSA